MPRQPLWPPAADSWLAAQPQASDTVLHLAYSQEARSHGWPERAPDSVGRRWKKLTGQTRPRGSQPIRVRCTQEGVEWPSITAAARAKFITPPGLSVALKKQGHWGTLEPIQIKG